MKPIDLYPKEFYTVNIKNKTDKKAFDNGKLILYFEYPYNGWKAAIVRYNKNLYAYCSYNKNQNALFVSNYISVTVNDRAIGLIKSWRRQGYEYTVVNEKLFKELLDKLLVDII